MTSSSQGLLLEGLLEWTDSMGSIEQKVQLIKQRQFELRVDILLRADGCKFSVRRVHQSTDACMTFLVEVWRLFVFFSPFLSSGRWGVWYFKLQNCCFEPLLVVLVSLALITIITPVVMHIYICSVSIFGVAIIRVRKGTFWPFVHF